jgi:hypothetical protein
MLVISRTEARVRPAAMVEVVDRQEGEAQETQADALHPLVPPAQFPGTSAAPSASMI